MIRLFLRQSMPESLEGKKAGREHGNVRSRGIKTSGTLFRLARLELPRVDNFNIRNSGTPLMRALLLISILTGSFNQPNAYAVTPTRPTAADRRQAIVELVGTLRVVTSGETWRIPSPQTVKDTFRRLVAISRKSRVATRAVIAPLIETFQSDP